MVATKSGLALPRMGLGMAGTYLSQANKPQRGQPRPLFSLSRVLSVAQPWEDLVTLRSIEQTFLEPMIGPLKPCRKLPTK